MTNIQDFRAVSRRPDDHDSLAAPRVVDGPTILRAFTPMEPRPRPRPVQPQRLGVLDVLVATSLVVFGACILGFGVPLLIEGFLIAVDALTGGTPR